MNAIVYMQLSVYKTVFVWSCMSKVSDNNVINKCKPV